MIKKNDPLKVELENFSDSLRGNSTPIVSGRAGHDVLSVAEKINGIELHIAGRVTETGDYYGAIAIPQIIESIFNETGAKVERRYVRLDESIKTPGTYNIDLKFPSDGKATIIVIAEIEE